MERRPSFEVASRLLSPSVRARHSLLFFFCFPSPPNPSPPVLNPRPETTALSLQSMGSSCLHPISSNPRPSLRVANKAFVGLKLQSSGAFGNGLPNVSAAFHSRVHQNLSLRLPNKKATRARVFMMPIGTPRVPYRTPGEGTWQWVDLWNALYRERVIFIGQHIDEEFSNQVLATMLYLDSIESSKKIYLYINGPGGDLTPSMAIYDTMQSLKSPVATQCVGYAYNLAGFLLAAGEKADDIRNEANELLRIKDYLFGELAKKTGQPVEKINKDLSRMKRFNAQEALEYGLIDRILRPARIKADAPRKEQAGAGLG
uniref:ATP-dependent Clp protease proteolytic subunit n=1 Tax=Elaeis guineensis var. tenera TaxID=51953 RepID=A0A6I9RZW0_ELAGV|nr:ATP-dependent Clp protease proteolytic subunit-related protein 2, chloroplastic isoform X2 [Elaeis guineensis]